eukprot:scaffold21061_cov79-Phaeocystis_antarctica.AAC.1
MRADPRASVAAMYSRARTLRCAGAQPEPPAPRSAAMEAAKIPANRLRNSLPRRPPNVLNTAAAKSRFIAVQPGPCLSTFSLSRLTKMASASVIAAAM